MITALADGRFVVGWTDSNLSGGDLRFAVRAQVFNADGSKAGNQFLVNTTTTRDQYEPVITALLDGRFVIAWNDNSQSEAVRAQVFNADGSKAGDEFLVTTTSTSSQVDLTALADGRFVIAWTDTRQSGGDTSGDAVLAQVFNADGSKAGGEFLVNTTTTRDQLQPTITALADGRFVIAWSDESENVDYTSETDVRARIFDPRTSAVDLIGSLDDDDLVGTIFNDTIAGFFGNDRLRGGAGSDRLFGEDGIDSLYGEAGNDILDGGAGNDILDGGADSDRLLAGVGSDILDGGSGNDYLQGGAGHDIFAIDTSGDQVIEAAGVAGGIDTVRSSTISLVLGGTSLANVENATLLGSVALNLTGSATANLLIGNAAANTLNGLARNDVLIGGGGADQPTGGTGLDRFILEDSLSADTITDFRSRADKLAISQVTLPIGNGDIVINGGMRRTTSGGFSAGAELVMFTRNIAGSITTTSAAGAIGSATSAYTSGDRRLFAVDNGSSSALFLFTAADPDSLVTASELQLLATLSGTKALVLADLLFSRGIAP